METVEAVLALMAACVALAVLARFAGLPYAVVLILAGSVIAFIPGLPQIALDPALALAFFLPPLLQASAYRTDWPAFLRNIRAILLLAVGCVIFTAFLIGLVARLLIPEMPWAAAIALGAILAPPDAVAAAAVLQRLNLPRRIVTVLEGESLVNDASALVIYRVAIAAMAAGSFVPLEAVGSFFLLGLGGIAVGWAVGRATLWAFVRLRDTLLETALSFLAGYAAFLAAEMAHLSGVMAVVTAGIMLGRAQHRVFSARTRLESRAVWQFIEFVLTSLIFILIGLELNDILERLGNRSVWQLAGLAVAVSLALIVSRFMWVFPALWLPRLIRSLAGRASPPPVAHMVILSWAGMRGVVSLAAALALPLGFPERDLIIFLAFCAILATLVLQGTTLEWMIKRLGLVQPPHPNGIDPEEARARHIAAQAMLEAIRKRASDVLYGPIASDLLAEHADRAAHLERVTQGGGAAAAERAARRAVRLEAIDAARAAILVLQAQGELTEELLTKLGQELDFEENRLRNALG
ncbi:Na+/H+ antiporter [Sediminicoccus sp. KRV36]|uniref:Na+/H+ antiporter n=1 Tax=Sediminicoccus sp. KRV36 TaxID=3133721 RepID=UPI00200FBE1A|nr:Na+/H+ antiporter [Sediminicoccus rosea]UPY37634.1 Na+/H+ antiporter [Sediminicoccus rosea]